MEDSGGLGGRNRALRSRRRPGRQGVGRPKWIVGRRPAPSPPGQGLFRAPGAVARPGSGPAWPCWPLPRCWPLAAPAQTQTEVWTATLTPGDLTSGILGCSNDVFYARCSNTSFLSEDSFNHDSTDYNITRLFVRSNGRLEFTVDADLTTNTLADLTLVVGSTSLVLADATTVTTRTRYWSSSGVSLTVGTDITVKLTAPGTPNAAPTVANTIPNQTATAGTAFSYAFLANTFDHPQALVPLPKIPARATALPAIVRRGGHPA